MGWGEMTKDWAEVYPHVLRVYQIALISDILEELNLSSLFFWILCKKHLFSNNGMYIL